MHGQSRGFHFFNFIKGRIFHILGPKNEILSLLRYTVRMKGILKSSHRFDRRI